MSRFYVLPSGWESNIDAWLRYLTAAGKSLETVRVRRGAVRAIARQSGTGHPREITADWLLNHCGTQAWSNDHRRTVRISLTAFYEWAQSNGVCEVNPAVVLPMVPESKPRPRPAPDEVWQALLAAAGPRERLMARLAGEAGLRRAEVARVHRDDLIEDMSGWSLIVHGKGARQRTVPLTDSLAAELRSYQSGSPLRFVFPGQTDGHLSPNCVGKLISALMPPGWSMHKLRHRFASRGYAGTKDLAAVRIALGHASLATTQRYVATPDSAVRAVSESAA